ncbi:MAG: polysaccharide pyruvyl transferase family protein [Bacteroidales bacterium]|jgi:hypothetical protein|nr:polysaccharide pyruvyl transferase family protein [Bacteroidales bacterium]
MKIGILTLPFNNNYGGFLQEYALMTVLKRMGHDVWFIDLHRCPQRSVLKTHLSFIKRIIKRYLLRRRVFTLVPSKYDRHIELEKIIAGLYTRPFVDKYLCPKISPVYSSEELMYIIKSIHFDVFVAGSDQIWRPQCMPFLLKTTYFDFLQERKEKKIIYAASFGTNEWEYTPQLTRECSLLAKQIHAISVREKSGIELCEKYLGVKAQWVLDPTMLLNRNDYVALIENACVKQSSGDMFCYILDKTNEKQEIINAVANQLALTPFYIDLKTDENDPEDKILEPVESWLRGFYDAKFVITDSFHGCVLSIIFNVPFLVYGNIKRGMSRFESLLTLCGLQNRLIPNNHSLKELLFTDIINWTDVNDKVIKYRQESIQFLLSHL